LVSICYAIDSDVRSAYHRETLGASLQGEQFASHHPGGRAEARSEERHIYAQEHELCERRSVVLGRVGGYTGDRYDELTCAHTERTYEKNRTTTESVNAVQSGKCCENVDQVDDDLEDKGVGELLDVFGEVRGTVVNLVPVC
jgi:hypothetical protein